jgi:hypothetical protein
MNAFCSNLDSYLLDDLSPAEAAAFAEHLIGCEECSEAIEQQQWIDGVLQSSSQLETQIPPLHLVSELQLVVSGRESTRKRFTTIALATAASLLIATTWLLTRSGTKSPNDVTATTDAPTISAPPHATFVADNDTIAVPVASRHPDVTIVRVYSTFRPNESRMATFQSEPTNSNNSTNFSNGG